MPRKRRLDLDLTIPPAVRCSFCHSYQPLIRHRFNPVDEYQEVSRFFCSLDCEAKWVTHQMPPPPQAKG